MLYMCICLLLARVDRQRDDNYKESELIDEWTQLQIERQVVLEPEPGTGVPGAPSSRCLGCYLLPVAVLS